MIKRKRAIYTILFLAALMSALLLTACAKKEASEKIVAVVNDYKMTGEDFNYESKEVLHMGKALGDIPVTKEAVLDALIIKEILLQEAERRGLDKDKGFMKTIELYWEQTLIRNLLTKKSSEIEKAVTVYGGEITDYYNKTKERIKAKVLVLADKRAGQILLGYAGDDIEEHVRRESEKFSLLYVIPARLYTLGEDNTPLEDSIFNIRKKDRELIEINGKCGLVIIEERISLEPEPLSAVRKDIAKLIKMKKERELMNEWIDILRSKARVRINKKVLEELQ